MANTDQKLVVSELDFSEIKNNLKSYLRDQTEFTDFNFEASGMSVLLDILAYNTHYMAYYSNMIANELFMDTALLRDSVVSHAKMLGYTPVSYVCPQAKIDLQIVRSQGNTQTTLTLPKFTRFQSTPIDSVSYTFINEESAIAEYDSTCNRFCFSNLYIKEGQPLSYTFVYDSTNNENSTFELPDTNIDMLTLEVVIQESSTSLRREKYRLATDVTTVSSDAAVYFYDETRNGKYQIYFGDDVIGKSLTDGNIVIVTYIKTNGAAANKANSFSLVESVGGFSSSIIYPIVPASGGKSQESIEKIRFSSSKSFVSNNRGVTKNDIIALINSKYPYFESINVWGGEENVPPVYGKVYIAAKPTFGYEITETEKLDVINNIIKPTSVVTVIPEFVDVDYNYINLYVSVFYDSTKTTASIDSVKSTIRNAIITYKNSELNNFNSRFKISKLLRYIDDSQISISYSDAVSVIEKKFVPQVGTSRNYVLNYGTALSREDPKHRIYSAPTFVTYDKDFVLRECFFDETPGTSSGIESVTIISATNNYLSTPILVISGDGVGANAYPIIVNGKVTQVVVDKPGINYTTAAVSLYYEDKVEPTASFNANIQGRYGVLRSYYFDDNNIKTILNMEAGEIDYLLGTISIKNFDPVSISDPLKTLRVFAKPATNNFESARQRILTIDEEDTGSIIIDVKPLA